MLFGIALGSNLGDRVANLRRGLELLLSRLPEVQSMLCGRVYETEPVDCAPGTAAFLNTVVEIGTASTPQEMHAHLQAVEQLLGRPGQRERNAPRALDLDLLYADDAVSAGPELIVPHPRLHLRRFVLQPLADIRPDLWLPGLERNVSTLLDALMDDANAVKLVEGVNVGPGSGRS